jgi:23S rRNA G2069 N7-methylase RlmK/C1962 C5-methylase RlmI
MVLVMTQDRDAWRRTKSKTKARSPPLVKLMTDMKHWRNRKKTECEESGFVYRTLSFHQPGIFLTTHLNRRWMNKPSASRPT